MGKWIVRHGITYTEGHVVAVFDKKADAIKAVKERGYKYNKKQDLYIIDYDDIFKNRMWYGIEKKPYNKLY